MLCDSSTNRQQARLGEILKQFHALGVADWLPDNVCHGRPVTAADYKQCCVALQSNRLRKFRHFLFVTGEAEGVLFCNVRRKWQSRCISCMSWYVASAERLRSFYSREKAA